MRVSLVAFARRCALVGGLLLGGTLAAAAPAADAEHADVRVLIDISGSMRQNDPENLRRPALRMLAGLLQPGTRAGVWTFARWTNNLVPVADVDAAWKKRTLSLSEQITSPGQFTNIEEVLDKASADWGGTTPTLARHLILLTDGMVDVSKEAGESERSRSRIIDELLPRLKAAGIKVHTIALSERADHDLMKRLAGETGGWYQQIAQADELQRAFLRMFETVGRPDALPLQDNRFTVDASIGEATVLVFRKPESPPTVLRSPSGQTFDDSDLTEGVAWFRDQGYDMITIASPAKGEWSLQADLDPDNRVMIVTDLKLQTSEVPSHMAVGEQTRIEAYLVNRGERVTRPAFLRLLEVHADATTAEGRDPQDLNDQGSGDDEAADDGRYTMRYGEETEHDSVELLIAVDSPTFMREKRFRIAVHEPAAGGVEAGPDGNRLAVHVQPAVMQTGAELTAWQQSRGGARIEMTPVQDEAGDWTAALTDPVLPVYFKIAGTSRLGHRVERTYGPLLAPGVTLPPEPAPAPEPAPVPEPVQAAEPAPSAPPAPAEPPAPEEAAPPPEEDAGMLMPALMFGGFNLLLLLGGGLWWFLRRRRGGGADDIDFDALVGGDAAADADKAAKGDAA